MTRFRAIVAAGLLVGGPALAIAQTVHAQTSTWSVEVYGGGASVTHSGNAPHLPNPGPGLTTSNPTFPTRQVSSWFFGDGAALLNDVAREFGLTSRVAPLDDLLARISRGRSGPAFGVRVARALSPGWSVNASVDLLASPGSLTGAEATLVEDARAGFAATIAGVLATGPFVAPIVDATATLAPGARRSVQLAGSIERRTRTIVGLVPFVTAGGGVIVGGKASTVTLDGHYRFRINGGAPIDETDSVTLRIRHAATPVLLFGGGAVRALSSRVSVRAEGRFMLGRSSVDARLDASPVNTTGLPAGVIESFTYPSIQFSNNASTGRRSSLSGPALQDFGAFTRGLDARFIFSLGLVTRF